MNLFRSNRLPMECFNKYLKHHRAHTYTPYRCPKGFSSMPYQHCFSELFLQKILLLRLLLYIVAMCRWSRFHAKQMLFSIVRRSSFFRGVCFIHFGVAVCMTRFGENSCIDEYQQQQKSLWFLRIISFQQRPLYDMTIRRYSTRCCIALSPSLSLSSFLFLFFSLYLTPSLIRRKYLFSAAFSLLFSHLSTNDT